MTGMRAHETIAEWSARVAERNARTDAKPHFVYRAFDEYGLLLYVGCSVNVQHRMGGHRGQSEWWEFKHRIVVTEPYLNKDAGRAAETEAISTESPFFNRDTANQFTIELTREEQRSRYLAARSLAAQGRVEAWASDPAWLDAHARASEPRRRDESPSAYLIRSVLGTVEKALIESGCPLTDEQRDVFRAARMENAA